MMGVSNLREFAYQNPPWVTFFLCLFSLAATAIFLSFYCSTHTLPNPDTEKDWNRLLSSLSQFQLCVSVSATSSKPGSPIPTPPIDEVTSLDKLTSKTRSTNLHLKVPLTLTTNSNSVFLKDMALHTALRGRELNLGGEEMVYMTLEFLYGNENYTCLTINAPTDLLPMNPLPPKCPDTEKTIAPINVEASQQLPAASQTCYSLHAENDPTLIVMLTREEQSLVGRHLLEASVFLFGVCFVICMAASLTQRLGRRHHRTGLDEHNEPLLDR